jgi:hypothetical protein
MTTGGIESFVRLQPANGTVGGNPYTEVGLSETAANQGGSIKVYRNLLYVTAPSTVFLQAPSVEATSGQFSATQIAGVSSINGAAYPPAAAPLTANPTFSTVQISTVQTPINVTAVSSIQSFNTVLGGMRMQGGVVDTSVSGQTINWANAFTTTPTVTATVASNPADKYASVTPSESNATFYVNNVGGTSTVSVYYLAIGAA